MNPTPALPRALLPRILPALPREASLPLRALWAIPYPNLTFCYLLRRSRPDPVAGYHRVVSHTNRVPNTRALPWGYTRDPSARHK